MQLTRDTLQTSRPRAYVDSTVGAKAVVAATGLLLVGYLVLHLAGNMLVLLGPAAFNGYAHFLIKNPLIYPLEIGLLAVFLLHVVKAFAVWRAGRRARPIGYHRPVRRFLGLGWAGGPSRRSYASLTMMASGVVTLLFVVAHLRHLKFGPEYLIAGDVRDLYRLQLELFASLPVVAFYVLCMAVVGAHLWHGFASAINSLGADHPRYAGVVLRAGRGLSLVVAGGFMVIPLLLYAGVVR
jgi:succinate dehydrogenase / fumarate reductase, cytochrome b subunit